MARQDYVPDGDSEFTVWAEAFSAGLASSGASVGIDGAEIMAAQAEIAATLAAISAALAQRNAAQAATATKRQMRSDTESLIRALVRRIKSHPAYTETLGQSLNIVGPEDTTDLQNARPTLTPVSVLAGAVTIGFNKSIADGVRILTRRGAESGFSLLAVDTVSPYVDTRANLGAGPETREYCAQYLDADDPVGQISDTLVVTVPG